MTPDVVVDIGNSRMKWGLVGRGRIMETAVLGLHDQGNWFVRAIEWGLDPNATKWAVASVNAGAQEHLLTWLELGPDRLFAFKSRAEIPMTLDVEAPDSVGLDRLLACLAAKRHAAPGRPYLVVQAGTALVVNYVNFDGVFAGGAILPGLSLMAKSLHEQTSQLPLIELPKKMDAKPGRTTEAAMRTGIYWSAVGAIRELRAGFGGADLPIYLTGGDAEILLPSIPNPVYHYPSLVLEGIRRATELQV